MVLEKFFKLVYKDSFTEEPKDTVTNTVTDINDYGWGFIAYAPTYNEKQIIDFLSVRTYKSLSYYVNDELAIYFTPNTFSSRKVNKRDYRHLRFLNAFFIDIDTKEYSVIELCEIIHNIGLPEPTLINETSKGYHVFFVFNKKIPATPKGKYLYNLINYTIVKQINDYVGEKIADIFAIGAERLIRIPKNIRFFENNTYEFSLFKDWLNINNEFKSSFRTFTYRDNIFNTEPVKVLLKGVNKGFRNTACYCVAKICQHAGMNFDEALYFALEWNKNNCPTLSTYEVKKTVLSAFKKELPLPRRKIEEVTGIKFNASYYYKNKKSRDERIRTHIYEYINDIKNFLKTNKGEWAGSQNELAKILNAPLRSIKEALKQIKLDKKDIIISIVGKGRGAKTILSLVEIKIINILHKIRSKKSTIRSYIERYLSINLLMVHSPYTFNSGGGVGFLFFYLDTS